ncbi:glycoside hydrolase family 3 N-terminal domain-containing protein [Azospirillum canadense]|uniref:glycoside hydrolase family 3 N-terminal domain-containing protein n=1 Tax=Azospirillum canadense TaxID=403962 RepID=UPI0022275610|nr:glycoside hydrolase family 3 N-terminal domain-containing protein [Azospirillum canadense]MCW2237658.1 beta-N-acetylhexosaminidase [Azospirillum canadense]
MRRVIGWCLGLALVFAGVNIHDPYLMPVRGWSAPAIAAVGLCGLLVVLRRGVRRRLALAVLWAAVPLAVLGAEGVFQVRRGTVLSAPGPLAAELGRHFIVGYERVEEVEALAARGLIGGVFVSRRNLAGRSAEALRAEIGRLQDIRRRAGLPPLRVAADQEGGIVSKLSPWLPHRPAPSTVAGLAPDERRAAARALGRDHGRDLRSLGVTINFAPVVDLRNDGASDPLDFNSLIARRAISGDPAVVQEVAAAYAAGLAEAGVRPTVKHFPGLGRVARDTHHFRAAIADSRETLESTDWQPFRHVLAGNPQALLMVGHVVLSAIDPHRPASHSRRVVDGVIRRDWGYDGLIVTDDLVMTPVYQYGLCRAVGEALNAGVDLLLVAFDGTQFYRAMACAMDAARRGELDPAALAASRERLDRISGGAGTTGVSGRPSPTPAG